MGGIQYFNLTVDDNEIFSPSSSRQRVSNTQISRILLCNFEIEIDMAEIRFLKNISNFFAKNFFDQAAFS